MTAITPYRSAEQDARDGFGPLLSAEWTKFLTVRGWVAGMIIAAFVTAGLGILVARTTGGSCAVSNGRTSHQVACSPPAFPAGPGGQPVTDEFYFVRQPLAGSGSITVRVTSLTVAPHHVPWAKAGIIIADGTRDGSAYAAMMVTSGNGVRMQWNYTGDTPGLSGAVSAASPRWLRLSRHGDTITGYDSADGTHWTRVGAVALAGLRSAVQAGLFVASPLYSTYSSSLGVGNTFSGPTVATAAFDHVSRTGRWPAGQWAGDYVGGPPPGDEAGSGIGYQQVAGRFTVSGSGDLAPLIAGPSNNGPAITVRDFLIGTFAGLIAVAVVATMFMTAEYRRRLIRTTFTASPSRGRVLAAKAIVIGLAAFVAGLAAAAGAVLAGEAAHGPGVFPEPWLTELRIIAGTALLVAVVAVLTLAVAAIVRRSATAILIVIATVVIPCVLSYPPGLPNGLVNWLLRVTPAAALALQQPAPQYYQVQARYLPAAGYYPLSPWAGFAVLCAWTAVALAAAAYLLKRRDA